MIFFTVLSINRYSSIFRWFFSDFCSFFQYFFHSIFLPFFLHRPSSKHEISTISFEIFIHGYSWLSSRSHGSPRKLGKMQWGSHLKPWRLEWRRVDVEASCDALKEEKTTQNENTSLQSPQISKTSENPWRMEENSVEKWAWEPLKNPSPDEPVDGPQCDQQFLCFQFLRTFSFFDHSSIFFSWILQFFYVQCQGNLIFGSWPFSK